MEENKICNSLEEEIDFITAQNDKLKEVINKKKEILKLFDYVFLDDKSLDNV